MPDWPAPGETLTRMLTGPAGGLEAEIAAPEGESAGVAVICHPHPQYGGTRHNKVVYTLARACREAGYAAVRFDFRGVGASEGGFDDGRGETEDALAVVEQSLRLAAGGRLLLAGFSFGAAVALRAAVRRGPAALVTVALPTGYFADALPRPDCPWLALHGDADEVVDTPAALRALGNLSPPPVVQTLPGVGHFFHGHLSDLRGLVADFLEEVEHNE